jgi:hypothetical protein
MCSFEREIECDQKHGRDWGLAFLRDLRNWLRYLRKWDACDIARVDALWRIGIMLREWSCSSASAIACGKH